MVALLFGDLVLVDSCLRVGDRVADESYLLV